LKITLCGSIRFEEYFRLVNGELTMRGHIVLAPGFFNHSFLHLPEYKAGERKSAVDELHLAKIDESDAIFVLDAYGYTGKSTQAEISHAQNKGKKVFYWSKGDLFQL